MRTRGGRLSPLAERADLDQAITAEQATRLADARVVLDGAAASLVAPRDPA